MAERFAVTGAAGFIGSSIVRQLITEADVEVVGVDNFVTGKRENIEDILDRFTFIEGDLGCEGVAEKAFAGADYVLHQAAIPSVPRSVDDPLATNYSCADVTLRVLMAARDKGVKRVVQAASSAAYGDDPELPKTEDMLPRPLSPYAVGKLLQEHYARSFSICYGLETVSLRYFNVFGPRQDPFSDYAAVIPKFIRLILSGKTPTIYGDGNNTRDFAYVDNVVSANILAARADGKFAGEVLNIACGESTDLNELVERINRVLGTSVVAQHGPPAPGDVPHSVADISRARELIGYRPVVDLDVGLEKTAAWMRAND